MTAEVRERLRVWLLNGDRPQPAGAADAAELADAARAQGLAGRLDEALARAYRRARLQAAKETGLDEDAFPATCPYDWNEIVAREFSI